MVAMAVKIRLLAVLFLALAAVSHAAGPENAHQVDATGWWECDRGYVMQSRPHGAVCVSESEVSHGPEMIVSGVLSAGDGARHLEGEASGSQAGGYAAPEASGAQPAPASLFIQSSLHDFGPFLTCVAAVAKNTAFRYLFARVIRTDVRPHFTHQPPRGSRR
jgi:hypothetical protein